MMAGGSGTGRPSASRMFDCFSPSAFRIAACSPRGDIVAAASATQDRQDAVVALLKDRTVDLMVVIGGYNSSNTANLARICAESKPTFHIADPDCLLSPTEIRHRPVGTKSEILSQGWLPPDGPVTVGVTSGASTPANLVALAIARLTEFCG